MIDLFKTELCMNVFHRNTGKICAYFSENMK